MANVIAMPEIINMESESESGPSGGQVTPASFEEPLSPEGLKCLQDHWNDKPVSGVYCNATWDTLFCWPPTEAGVTAKESCANVFTDFPDLLSYPDAYAFRECDEKGVWHWGGWTNYSQCLHVMENQTNASGVVEAVRYITFTGALLSLFTLTITIFIFTYFREFVAVTEVHNLLDRIRKCARMPTGFIMAWTITMSVHYPVQCWKGYGNLNYVWILVGPMVTALLVNLLFLINIIRILVTKLRASDAVETTQVRKAIKATVVLFPLLGITNLLFAVNPGDKGELEGAYMITNALLQSSQGVFVSVLYCFLNSEVQEILKKRWRQYRLQQMGYPANHRRKSTKSTIILPSTFSPRTSPQTSYRSCYLSRSVLESNVIQETSTV
ncbi:corticotropin-releasing factor receptor 2-like [Palaemon carinicauda]|uniref:corticotropin-releasing factor receptor 2-like n=1 Tax=Palaemon carinicauda TaxID=392227 RepID=UPI0035B5CFAD